MRSRFALLVLCACSANALAQTKNPVTTVVKEILPRQAKNLEAAVDLMPAGKFSYRPSEGQMTFGKLVGHIIESNYYLCERASDVPQPKTEEPKETDSKEKLAAALKASFDYCTSALAKVDDSTLGDTIHAYGGREAPRAWAYIAMTNDWSDHYAAAAQYLRLNGILPPTAKKKE